MFSENNEEQLSPNAPVCSIGQIDQRACMIELDGQLMSETDLEIQAARSFEGWCKISLEGKPPVWESLGQIDEGQSRVTVHVPELIKDNEIVGFEVYDNPSGSGEALACASEQQKKVRRWKVHIAHDLHMDIGFTDYQETLRNKTFPSYLDDALRYVEETKEWEPASKFRYPMEASYLLHGSAWNVRDADWVQKLKKAMADGTITYPSNYAHFVTEGLGTEETARVNYFSERFVKDRFGADSTKVVVKTDDPGISWGSIDAMVDAGVRYLMLRFNDPDWETVFGTGNQAYPKLFYMEGKNPKNKLLVYNAPRYALEEYEFDFKNPDSKQVFGNICLNLMAAGTEDYPYDAVIQQFTTPWDNNGITPQVKDNIKAINGMRDGQGRKYVYPQVISSTTDDFFRFVEDGFSAQIPAFRGTIESWWAFGPSSAAYEIGLTKENHDKVPAAEFFASMANAFVSGAKYPYEKIHTAYDQMLLFDEHTWSPNPQVEDNEQWNWKRNTAISCESLSNSILEESVGKLGGEIRTDGPALAVYNSLAWPRTDLVRVPRSKLPDRFRIRDAVTGQEVPHQKTEDGDLLFVAEQVPALGYKCFHIEDSGEEPEYTGGMSVTDRTLENRFFKVTFDDTGSIVSIVDKYRGNREMVDSSSPYSLNQFVYYTTHRCSPVVLTTDAVELAELTAEQGAVMAVMTAASKSEGVNGLKRKVILYDAIPRIDIVNEVDKKGAHLFYAQDEEGFFTFPFHMENFEIRHEMPTGDVKPGGGTDVRDPETEQFVHSCTDHYSVNRWIDVSDKQDYGIVLSPINSPLVQYGKRTSFQKIHEYKAENPWIYSYAFNNKWFTNFPKTQPGPVTLKYSITTRGGKDWKEGRVDRFGWEIANGLKAAVIPHAQTDGLMEGTSGSFLKIDSDHVALTAAKIAEANGEGMILRFNETKGENATVSVDLGRFNPSIVTEISLVEDDRAQLALQDGKVSFDIDAYGWKTIRVVGSVRPEPVSGVSADVAEGGTLVIWEELDDRGLAHYEVFRDVTDSFIPGTGNYIASVNDAKFFDVQVKKGLVQPYFYKVRAVKASGKGEPSAAAGAVSSEMKDDEAPSAPADLRVRALSSGRVSVEWDPSSDNWEVAGYKVYRNGRELKDLPAIYNSHLDMYTVGGQTIEYTVCAYDASGNLSKASRAVKVTTPKGPGNTLDISDKARITASSCIGERYEPENAVDGWIGLNGYGEWASDGELNPWIEYRWDGDVNIDTIVLADRPDVNISMNKGVFLFGDGSELEVPSIPANGASLVLRFAPKTVNRMKLQVTGGTGNNVGLSELRVYAVPAGGLQGNVTVSSTKGVEFEGFYALNGIAGICKRNEWASDGETNPWIQVDFEENTTVGRIVIRDRIGSNSNLRNGELLFSDGSMLTLQEIPTDGSPCEIAFPAKTVRWVRFSTIAGEGHDVGMAGFDIFGTE